jgi:hypothetical protein
LQSVDNRRICPDIIAFQDIIKSSFLSREIYSVTIWLTLSSVKLGKIYEMYQRIIFNNCIFRILDSLSTYQNYSFDSEGLSYLYKADAIFNNTILSVNYTNVIE